MKKVFKCSANELGWHKNTHLCVNVKTLLRSDVRMKAGKEYPGVFKLDSDAEVDDFLYRDPHYTFVETVPLKGDRRNPQVFRGEFITITRQADGTPRPNFRSMPIGEGFSLESYVTGVANELLWALKGLVEER